MRQLMLREDNGQWRWLMAFMWRVRGKRKLVKSGQSACVRYILAHARQLILYLTLSDWLCESGLDVSLDWTGTGGKTQWLRLQVEAESLITTNNDDNDNENEINLIVALGNVMPEEKKEKRRVRKKGRSIYYCWWTTRCTVVMFQFLWEGFR